MSTFWNLWIVGFVTANIIFIAWLLYATSSGKKSDQPAGPETTGHIWDGDLQEYNNPLPRWWLAVFYASIVFAILYLALYPGFGNFKGLLGWSATNELQGQEAEGRLTTARVLAKFDGKSIAELAADPEALGVAENLFAANCTACHGADAHGNKGFPNLARPDLSWGRSEAAILATITAGRQGVMPAWKDILGTESVTRVANYVYSLSGRPAPDITAAAAGAQTFATTCAMCHGATGQGNLRSWAHPISRVDTGSMAAHWRQSKNPLAMAGAIKCPRGENCSGSKKSGYSQPTSTVSRHLP